MTDQDVAVATPPTNDLEHRYFDTANAIVRATVDHDLPPLVAAVHPVGGAGVAEAGEVRGGR